MGKEKAESPCPGAGQCRHRRRHTGAAILLVGNERAAPLAVSLDMSVQSRKLWGIWTYKNCWQFVENRWSKIARQFDNWISSETGATLPSWKI